MENNITTLDTLIDSLQLVYKAKFVPMTRSANAHKDSLSINWLITISKNNTVLKAPYSQGCGNLENFSHSALLKVAEYENVKFACEKGKWTPNRDCGGSRLDPKHMWKQIPKPKLKDVLYSLVMASYALDMAFEEWASEYGYDSDSREAEQTFIDCVRTGIKLLQLVGHHKLEQLREAFKGY